jgi:hypothetical protein
VRVLDPYFDQGGTMHGRLIPPRRLRRPLEAAAVVGVLTLCVAAGALRFSSAAGADSTTCADTITSAPTGPATVSTETKAPFGKVLVVGSGQYDGCSLSCSRPTSSAP